MAKSRKGKKAAPKKKATRPVPATTTSTFFKDEYLHKSYIKKDVYYFRDDEFKINRISKEVMKNEDVIIHYPIGYEGAEKYKTIKRFIFKGFEGALPVGFWKVARYGYGFHKRLRAFVEYIESNFDFDEVIIEKMGPSELDIINKRLQFSEEHIVLLNRIFTGMFSKHSIEFRNTTEKFLHNLFPTKIKEPSEKYIANSLATTLSLWGNSLEEFSNNDKVAIKELFEKLTILPNFFHEHNLAKTKEIIDNEYISKALEEFKNIMTFTSDTKTLEKKWQVFLRTNSWIFSTIFAQPVILYQDEAYVGGKTIANKDGKMNDFLISNDLSNNASFLEIKTHLTELVDDRAYRGTDVFGASNELAGCISQVLNQRDNFQKHFSIFHLKNKDIQTFNSKAVVLIGSLKSLSESQRDSFELIRSNSRDVEILTFDELERKIEGLLRIMTGKV